MLVILFSLKNRFILQNDEHKGVQETCVVHEEYRDNQTLMKKPGDKLNEKPLPFMMMKVFIPIFP